MLRRLSYIFLTAIIVLTTGCTSDGEEGLQFEDTQLTLAIKDALSLEESEIISEKDAADLLELDGKNYGISSLKGIEALVELKHLDLQDNHIEDLTPLLNLENLETVLLYNNPFSLEEGSQSLSIIHELEEDGIVVHYEETFIYEETGPPAEGVFYKVENGNNTVYLFGSIHVGMADIYPLHPAIEGAFEEADYLAVEIDLTDISDFEMMELIGTIGFYEDGSTLEQAIGGKAFKQLVDLLAPFGYEASMLNFFKPFVVQDLVTMLAAELAGLHPDDGIDLYFMERANKDDIEIISLETVEDQLLLSTILSEETQAKDLIDSIENFDQLSAEVEQLMNIWRNGDTEAILELRESEYEEDYEEYMKALLDDRDYLMTEKIEEFLLHDTGETYFVVVGAMHLVGEKSIVGLLNNRGYNVQPVIN
ncbi:uncharacterized protein YbaP (TraB family) [Evansella vedderi]|uniref:Uncharacterized protein YbaP (TraB family) n=1 Tax=Evansella vedderi TaxID=38282 RepID=A0ABT9ZTD4_9BACI|nr:TraB/GumN family protein [Evansella vedderi]MDQ0254007.1 uncharacterized protein YbaP (TraB family) [Evansella vedderi]